MRSGTSEFSGYNLEYEPNATEKRKAEIEFSKMMVSRLRGMTLDDDGKPVQKRRWRDTKHA